MKILNEHPTRRFGSIDTEKSRAGEMQARGPSGGETRILRRGTN